MGAIAIIGGALEPVTAGLLGWIRSLTKRVRFILLMLALDTSRKHVDVLVQSIANDAVAMRAFPLYQVQIKRRMRETTEMIGREYEHQSSIHIKLMHLQ